jgi:hypothetical protein
MVAFGDNKGLCRQYPQFTDTLMRHVYPARRCMKDFLYYDMMTFLRGYLLTLTRQFL